MLCRREILFLIDRSCCVSCNANKYKIKFFMREANYQRRRLVRGQVGNKNILNLCLFFYNQTHRFFELNKKKKQEIIANSLSILRSAWRRRDICRILSYATFIVNQIRNRPRYVQNRSFLCLSDWIRLSVQRP